MSWRDLSTPAFVVDIARVTRNAQRMRAIADAAGASLRPHVKTHKCIEILRILQEAGGVGRAIVVSTLLEAEFFADAGAVDDILLAVPFDVHKLDRALSVASRVSYFGLLVDSAEALALLVAALAARSSQLAVLTHPIQLWVEIDTGYHRCGVDVTAGFGAAIELVQAVVSAAVRVEFAGLYAHSGHAYNCCPEARDTAASRVAAAAIAGVEGNLAAALVTELRAAHGISVPVVSLGATPSVSSGAAAGWPTADALGGTTRLELHPGNYAFYDRQQVASGSCSLDDIACCVVARVVGRYPERAELVLDCGSSALHKDPAGLADGTWGELAGRPDLVLTKLTQELAVVRAHAAAPPLDPAAFPLGTPVCVLPNHACMAAAQHAVYHAVQGPLPGAVGEEERGGGGTVCATWRPAKFW